MNKGNLLLLFLTAICLINCKVSSFQSFINKYGDERFPEFKNTNMVVRSIAKGEEVIFAYDNAASAWSNGAYVITVDVENRIIKAVSCHLMKDTTLVDRKKMEKLALKFVEYPIGYLGVDSDNNIFISIKANTSPELIYFSNIQNKKDAYKEWRHVKDGWYEKP